MTDVIKRLKNWRRPDRKWPKYLPGGRIRTSTAALVAAFVVLSWIHQTYQPAPSPSAPETQVVPPGFVPDPAYTWVPRTKVRTPMTTATAEPTETTATTQPTETTDTSAPVTASTSPVETTSPGETTPSTPDSTSPATPTPLPPGATPQTTVANRSGTPVPPAPPGPGPSVTPPQTQ